MSKLPILSHTYKSYCQSVCDLLGKGYRHAGLIYSEFYRTGKVEGKDPAFANAQALLKDILELTDFSILPVCSQTHDGFTGKFLLRTENNLEIESVLIPMQAGGTLCVSSQVGCRMGCAFCETGRMGLLRNLTAQEILSQVFAAKFRFKFPVRNIVFMGMGEPFDNYDSVIQAVKILQDLKGFGFGKKNITISTSGCIDGIQKLILETECAPNLAVSINAPNDGFRNKLMPINRKHSMKELYGAMQQYNRATGRQILAAYVLLKDMNDSVEQAEELASYLKGLDVKINLIPYNSQSCERYGAPESVKVDEFAKKLRSFGYYTLVRTTKGDSIMAACGQLGNLDLRRKNPKI